MESYFVRITDLVVGLFFVIEGFLDIVLPTERRSPPENEPSIKPPVSNVDSLYDVETASSGDSNISNIGSPKESSKQSVPSVSQSDSSAKAQRPLFTVKPGGIAGYLGKALPVD
jgi:lysophospholipid hydrolase